LQAAWYTGFLLIARSQNGAPRVGGDPFQSNLSIPERVRPFAAAALSIHQLDVCPIPGMSLPRPCFNWAHISSSSAELEVTYSQATS
jgi:hypothetical protein